MGEFTGSKSAVQLLLRNFHRSKIRLTSRTQSEWMRMLSLAHPTQGFHNISISPRQDDTWGCGSQVVKVSDRGWPCHEFEPTTTKESPSREEMHVESVESSNVLPLVWCGSLEMGCQLRCRRRYLTMVQNYVVRHQEPSCS
ncbi:hypothetical protein TNCV_2565751 [Trichonephila clavipes]|nr:hypothetical protein TNCV_2565751 [Trichonephila clavipes]